ncbi:MAG: BrnA antitoxin family protein [Granulosicoccus sp.]
MTTSKKSLDELSISKRRLAEMAAIPDEDIDTSDIPELDEAFWANARVRFPGGKERLTVRFDEDMVQWFRDQGRGYQTKMNAVLRSFYETHKDTR